MPRDATATRSRIIAEAERLFAEQGIWQVPTSAIVKAAGQRNASAITYHFGSREQLLGEILLRHGDPIDGERGELLVDLDDPSVREIMTALVTPMSRRLHTDAGRSYLRIVDQVTDRFDLAGDTRFIPPNLASALGRLERGMGDLVPALRAERLRTVVLLMMSSLADRARRLTSGRVLDLDDDAYTENLADMLVGVVEAPVTSPVA